MSEDEMQTRVVELETRLAYQEDTINQLNAALVAQQRQLEQLSGLCEQLRQRLLALGEATGANPDAHEPPPHY